MEATLGLPAGAAVPRRTRARCAATREIACDGLSPASPYRATMLHIEGVSHLLEGDRGRGRRRSSPAPSTPRRAPARCPFVPSSSPSAASRRSSATTGPRPRRSPSEALAHHGGRPLRRLLDERPGVRRGRPGSPLQRGDVEQGAQHVARAARLRPLLNYALPVVSVQALLEMARAYIALGDPGGARAVLRQADDIFQQRPDLGTLPDDADELRAQARRGPRPERSARRR